jgi:hypothetical protein
VDSPEDVGPEVLCERPDAGREDGRTAMPLLRSPGPVGRVGVVRGATRLGRDMARPSRRAATSGSTSPRPSRPSHETQSIASTVATNGGTSHHRISTRSG